jgi:hypothetical protein
VERNISDNEVSLNKSNDEEKKQNMAQKQERRIPNEQE